jgi:hypothetical protein
LSDTKVSIAQPVHRGNDGPCTVSISTRCDVDYDEPRPLAYKTFCMCEECRRTFQLGSFPTAYLERMQEADRDCYQKTIDYHVERGSWRLAS